MSSIPELCPHRQKLLNAASHYTKLPAAKAQVAERYNTLMSAYHEYSRARQGLDSRCTCPLHLGSSKVKSDYKGVHCLSRIAETALVLTYCLGSLLLHEPLMPKRYGILKIYSDLIETGRRRDEYPSRSELDDFYTLRYRLTMGQALVNRFLVYITLFSGSRLAEMMSTSISAMSDGKVYCYIDTLQSLSDQFEKASTIHVGAGSIQAGNRLYYRVLDRRPIELPDHRYQARKVEIVERGLCPFAEDFTNSDLRVEAIIEESVHLSFCYRVSSTAGNTSISPAHFVLQELAEALDYKTQLLSNVTLGHINGIVDQHFSVIHGEGIISQPVSTRITVRPHRGNDWGRCVALVTSSRPTALLSSEGDLSTFMELWASKDEKKAPGEDIRFTLIS